jgi:hypothetical protein
VQVISSVENSGKRLLLAFVQEELDAYIVEMIPNNVTGVGVCCK